MGTGKKSTGDKCVIAGPAELAFHVNRIVKIGECAGLDPVVAVTVSHEGRESVAFQPVGQSLGLIFVFVGAYLDAV